MSRSSAVAGSAMLVVAWFVVPHLSLPPFTAHMASHMIVVAVASPLLAVAVAGSRLDPVARSPERWSPIAAAMVELVLVWGWHAPTLHHAARHHAWVHVLEQACFLGAGTYLWLSSLGGTPTQRRNRAPRGVAGLLLTSTHMTLLGAIITLSGRLLYASHHAPSPLLSPIHDQQLGGATMLVIGMVAYLAGGLWLVADAGRDALATRRSRGAT